MSWHARIVRFLSEDDPPKVLALQPMLFHGARAVWEGHQYEHACESCELTAWVEAISCAAMLGLAPAGRPDPATLRLRPAPGLAGLAGWGGVPDLGAVAWQHNEALCAPTDTVDQLIESTRLALTSVAGGDCRKMRQPNCVVARLVEEIDRLRAGGPSDGGQG